MSTEILKEILAYIDEHIYEKISLLELAEMAGYSPFYFSKLFSEIMGMPITGYIRIRKLHMRLVLCWRVGKFLMYHLCMHLILTKDLHVHLHNCLVPRQVR